jgi:hypothetical protein
MEWIDAFAADLAAVPGAVGVVLGGSRARGTHTAASDVDLGVYYRGSEPIDVNEVRKVILRYHNGIADPTVTQVGEWGPWINGGSWFQVGGVKADLLYRDLDKVSGVMDECMAGRFSSHYQPGHPAVYASYILMGEVGVFRILEDPQLALAALKSRTATYPPALRASIIAKFGWEAGFQFEILEKAAPDDAYYHQCGIARSLTCVVQVLYSLNERWYVNEKRAVQEVSSFPKVPRGFAERVDELVGGGALSRLRSLIAEVDELTHR